MSFKKETIVKIKKSDDMKRIIYGEVYCPDEKDTDENWMTREEIEKMAYNFMEKGRSGQINKHHKGAKDKGNVVETFIVRKGDPDFIEGAWVIAVHVTDNVAWEEVKKGELTGFSIEGKATLIEEKKEEEGDLE